MWWLMGIDFSCTLLATIYNFDFYQKISHSHWQSKVNIYPNNVDSTPGILTEIIGPKNKHPTIAVIS